MGVVAINPNGEVYTERNMSDRLLTRNLMTELRSGGLSTGGGVEYSEKDKHRFASSLDKYVTRQLALKG